jgi:hypothetical protein
MKNAKEINPFQNSSTKSRNGKAIPDVIQNPFKQMKGLHK